MQIIHFKKFSVPVCTGTLKVDKLLKMPSDSISEGVIFQNSLGGHTPDPLVLACFACLCASHTMSVNMLISPTSTMMTGLVVPPLFKSLDLPLITMSSLLIHTHTHTHTELYMTCDLAGSRIEPKESETLTQDDLEKDVCILIIMSINSNTYIYT